MRGPAARARNAGACSWSLQCEECGTQGWNGQMLRDYYGRAPPSFFDCCNAATGRSLMYTSVARLGIDSAARARRKLLASVFRRFTEGFDSRVSCRPDFTQELVCPLGFGARRARSRPARTRFAMVSKAAATTTT